MYYYHLIYIIFEDNKRLDYHTLLKNLNYKSRRKAFRLISSNKSFFLVKFYFSNLLDNQKKDRYNKYV